MFLSKFKILLVFLLFILLFIGVFKKETHARASDIFTNPRLESFGDDERAGRAKEGDSDTISIFKSRWDIKTYSYDLPITLTHAMATCMYIKDGKQDPELCRDHQAGFSLVSKALAYMYSNPPASGVGYAYNMLANAGILAKPAYAQGIGFSGLTPFLPLWTAARNIAYTVIIVIMIAIGFMIIFRMKIDPKTVISVQAAIPKIVLTLILITFSYAIVGFMIDIMYLTMGITISVMAKGMGWENEIAQLQSQYMNGGIETLGGSVLMVGVRTLDDFFKAFFGLIAALEGVMAGLAVLTAVTGPVALFIGIGVPVIFLFFLFLGLLFTLIRLTLLLFNSYVQLLISLILGPIFLLTEAIPGQSAFTQWILNILANLVVFPATVAILMFAMFLAQINITGTSQPLWSPPLTGIPSLGTETTGTVFVAFLAISVIFLAPSLVASIKKIFHPKSVLPVSMGTAFSPLTGGISTGMGAMQSFYYVQMTMEHGIGAQIAGWFKNALGQKKP